MKQHRETLEVRTRGREFADITREAARVVRESGVGRGMLVAFCQHTSAGLCVQENADRAVQRDLLGWLARAAPDGDPEYEHDDEGPDDMAAHVRSMLTGASVSIPIEAGALALGTWQALYLVEHRIAPHVRRVMLHVMGE